MYRDVYLHLCMESNFESLYGFLVRFLRLILGKWQILDILSALELVLYICSGGNGCLLSKLRTSLNSKQIEQNE